MSQYTASIQQLYVAYFGRPADPIGLAFWENVLTTGSGTTATIADAFSTQTEYTAAYAGKSPAEIVNQVYINLFGHGADAGGLVWWASKLTAGVITVANVVTAVAAGAQGTDKVAFDNKVAAATAFTTALDTAAEIVGYNTASASVAKSFITSVTDDASLAAAVDAAALDATITQVVAAGEPVIPTISAALTTGVDSGTAFTGGAGSDTFNADQSSGGSNTLNSLDRLNGGAGVDTLNAVLSASVLPASLANIETIVVTSTGGNANLGLNNAAAVTSVTNLNSTDDLTVSGIAAGATLAISNVASLTTAFEYAVTTGTQTAALTLNGVTGGAAAEITIAGVETVNVTATGNASTYELKTAGAGTLGFAGDVTQTVTLDATVLGVSKFDASAATGSVKLTTIDQTALAAATDVTVLGGAGNDTLTLVESNDMDVNAGAGDDTIVMTGIDTADTVNGGAGTDTLSTNSAQANVLDAATPTTYTITNVETLKITDTFNGTLSTGNIATSLNKVVLANTAGGNLVAGSNDTIVGAAGTFALDLGASGAGNTDVLAGALVVSDTGSATTDTATISNKAVDSTTGLNLDVFNGQDLTSNGYENLVINTGSISAGPEQDIGTLTITPDTATAAVSLTLSGTNAIEIATSVTTTSTGLLTINASGLTAQAAGTATLTIASTSSGTGGTQNITGSAGDDSIVTGNFASTISGGAGDDTITGGTTADSLLGGAGDDVITGTSGADTVSGGDGDDTITVGAGSVNVDGGAGDDTVNVGATLTSGDTVVGGAGTDTLEITAAVTTGTVGARVSGFEVLSTTATAQVMSNFTNNTFTEVVQAAGGNGTLSITNASSTFTKLVSNEADALVTSFSRLADGAADSLTVVAGDAIIATSALTASGEETIIIDASDFGVDLDLVTATSLTTLTVEGDNAIDIDAQAATGLATINAAGVTGTAALSIDASDSTSAVTFTGGTTTGTTTLTTGSGSDLITAGAATAVLNVTTGLGNDTVIGNAGADIIVTGSGADSITGGNGADSITAGAGNDTIVLTETTAAVDVVVLTSTGLDTVTGFSYGASGDQIEFDISDLETAYNIDFANLDDGASTGAADGLIQEVTADVAATADATFFVLRGATFDTTADVENALETGDFEISHAGAAAGDGFLVAYSDGVDAYVALVRINAAASATDFAAGELTVTNLVKLVGNTSLSASEFNIANFDFIA